MKNESLTLRQRFNRLRAAMQWSWKDIDAITGRKNARTNIAKRVPAWSMLAIHAHEAYEVILRHHLIELIGLYLGDEFRATKLSGGAINFIGVTSRENKVESVLLVFQNSSFKLISDNSRIYELSEQLKSLHPVQSDIVKSKQDGEYELIILIELDAGQKNKQ